MEYNRIFQDDFVSFDTVIEGETLGSTSAEKSLNVFGQLGIIDSKIDVVEAEISVAGLQEFVDRFGSDGGVHRAETPESLGMSAASAEICPSTERGIGSFSTVCYARWFLSLFATEKLTVCRRAGKIVPVNQDLKPTMKGKISDYIFIADADGKTGSGHLSVDVTEEFFKNRQRNTVFHHWDIEIKKYEVHQRVDAGFPDFPFPVLQGNPELKAEPDPKKVLVDFPKEAIDPENDLSVWHRGLDHKLFARGKGGIKIHKIYESVNGSKLSPLPREHPWYTVDDESCVDLMFKGYPPAIGLPPQSNYCLGRCVHPKIINTCGD